MEMILLNDALEEIGPVRLNVDFEVGTSKALNNFELSAPSALEAGAIYVPDTEWGGIFEYYDSVTDSESVTLKGWTWRGLLTQSIISPPSGSDYKIVSGEANTIIRDILSGVLGGFFTVPDIDSGLTITSYQFKLYTTVLDGLMDMLSEYGYRLKIYARKEEAGGKVQIYVEAVPSAKLDGQYDSDSGIRIRFTDNRMGINHLVCMGTGELQSRQRVDLYMQKNGTVAQTQYYSGFQERTAYYDYSSAQSLAELIKYGTERLLELANSKKFDMSTAGEDLEVGDIVIGRERKTGIVIEKPIIKKILKITSGVVSVEYEVKGEE